MLERQQHKILAEIHVPLSQHESLGSCFAGPQRGASEGSVPAGGGPVRLREVKHPEGHCRCPTVDAPPMCMPVPTQCDTADTPKLFLAVLGYRPALTGNPAHQV